MDLPPSPSRRPTRGTKSSAGNYSRGRVSKLKGVLLQLPTHSAYQESLLCSRLDRELPKTCIRKLFLRALNTRSSFILLQVLDLLTTMAAFRVGGSEVNPLVASLTIHFGRLGGVVLSKLLAVLLMFGVRRRLWVVNLFYVGVICWNLIVVISLVLHRR